MASTASNKDVLMSTYAARLLDDVEGTMAAFADDVVFEFNGRGTRLPNLTSPVQGKAALWPVMREFVKNFHFSDWRVISFLSDGDKALLHWRALVTFTGNGKSAEFDVLDLATFRDGKITAFHQSTDTAMITAMTAA